MSQLSKGKVLDAAELFYDSDTGKLLEVRANWTTEAGYGDQIGYIDWPSVRAVTWRKATVRSNGSR